MIIYSDNNAYEILLANIDKTFLSNVYNDFGIILPDGGHPDSITARDFSLFLRVLYNASYLDKNYSEKALELLTETEFEGGLTLNLPKNITVAHKFGERFIGTDTGQEISEELHDCGIIYYPGHPYVLCVMTKGKDFNSLALVISNISKKIYTYVSSEYH